MIVKTNGVRVKNGALNKRNEILRGLIIASIARQKRESLPRCRRVFCHRVTLKLRPPAARRIINLPVRAAATVEIIRAPRDGLIPQYNDYGVSDVRVKACKNTRCEPPP